MFKLPLLLKKHKKKIHKLDNIKMFFIVAILLCILCGLCICIISFSNIKILNENNLFYKYLFDTLNLLFILIAFILLQCTNFLVKEAHVILSVGLFLWGGALFFIVYNDINIQPIWISLWMSNIFRTIGISLLIIGAIIAIKKSNRKCNYFKVLATIDDLTELPNRRYFYEESNKHEDKMILFIMIDIDNFKKINDKYGHDEGDRILHSFGKVLLNYKNDNIFSARLGGDEFAAFIISSNKQEAVIFAEYLLEEIKKIIVREGNHITLSIGMTYKLPCELNRSGLQRADKALYKAKNNNRNRFEWE
ncbi:GGDEF domain-containing protein [Photobacterium toruni]|uniref:diguanylate cyclase n=1 Tax=Photobacterium toruni TaxID=1935446 RepID=A0A1T4RR13_9GAMM|nr:GGDEF domain-containing protein [Photobacterium toruni]SKA18430.1 putative diguanylate cyclase YcdT [Photobacterium toruni]